LAEFFLPVTIRANFQSDRLVIVSVRIQPLLHLPQSQDRREDQDRCKDRGEVPGLEEREGFGVGWEVRGVSFKEIDNGSRQSLVSRWPENTEF